jgi:hypothetical protein
MRRDAVQFYNYVPASQTNMSSLCYDILHILNGNLSFHLAIIIFTVIIARPSNLKYYEALCWCIFLL